MCVLQEFDLQIQHSLPSNKCQQEATINFTAVLKTIKQLKQGETQPKCLIKKYGIKQQSLKHRIYLKWNSYTEQ